MVRRFLAAFGLVLLYMAVMAGLLFVAITLAGDDDAAILVVVLVFLVLILALFVPYLDLAAKKVFFFRGEGQPVPADELRARIQAINHYQAPVRVEERKGRLVVTWNYVDARWWEILAKAGLTKVYELHIKFHGAQPLVTLIDVTKSVAWRAGPTQVRLRGGFFRGVIFVYEIGKRWGIRENFELGKVSDYRFVPRRSRTPS